MRADRLLAILLLLQRHGRLTAHDLAQRLEVSARTIQRDMLALSIAGAPVYAERGVRGGWALAGPFHVDMSGLTASEAESLAVGAPAALLADLGLRGAAATALVKLVEGLPERQRLAAEEARQRVYVDAAGWRAVEAQAPTFATVQEAVWGGRRLEMTYERGGGEVVTRVVDPLGLVAKGRVWYLVAAVEGDPRTYRAQRILAATALEASCARPPDFDLAAYWEQSQRDFAASLPTYQATARLDAACLPYARAMWRFGAVQQVSEQDADGWVVVEAQFETRREACFYILGMGAQAEVITPEELRSLVSEQVAILARRAAGAATTGAVGHL